MTRRLILAIAPAALALATFAHAQAPAQPKAPPSRADFQARHEAMKKQHMDDLRTVLRLRPDQEASFAAFTASHQPQVREFRHSGDGDAPMTTPQRLDQMAKRDAEREARRKQHREALGKFYAALSPDQQKVFDALQRLQRHDGPGGGPGTRMMHGAGPDGGRRMIIREHREGPGPSAGLE